MATTSDFTKSIIALACWRAAKTELHQVMLSVCMVFKNRADAGWYEGSIYENAAEWLREHDSKAFPDERDPQFQQLLVKLDAVIAGLIPDKTGGAIWFYQKAEEDIQIPEGYSITTVIGSLVFVR